jgi:hypothetical protein
MSDYIKGLKEQTKELEKRREPLLKKIKELKEQFKEKHKNRGPSRKLKTKWTVEAQQDLNAMHNTTVEKTLTDILADEIRQEIDNEVINDMQKIHYRTTKRSRRGSRK